MQAISDDAQAVFDQLIEGVTTDEPRTIDNSDTFMAVHVEHIDTNPSWGRIYSIAHYFKQNGDMLCDPDVTLLVQPDARAYPLTFEMGGMIFQRPVELEDEGYRIDRPMQRGIAEFCNDWMSNIAEQQKLDVTAGVRG